MEPHDYLRHTLDPVRLAILGSAILAPVDAEAIAGVLGVRRQKGLRSIVRLTEVGLLDPDGKLDVDVLISIGAQLPDIEAAAAGITDGTWDAGSQGAPIIS